MAGKSKIEWTDATWNPVSGCKKVSAGCKNCYAKREWPRHSRPKGAYAGRKFEDVACHPERLRKPLSWQKPQMVFVNSMSDLFHDAVPDEFIDRVFAVMALTPQHTFQILTKRAERMREYLGEFAASLERREPKDVERAMAMVMPIVGYSQRIKKLSLEYEAIAASFMKLPLPNVWMGVSVENQATADARIPELLATPAAVRFVSYEPALGPVDFESLNIRAGRYLDAFTCDYHDGDGEVIAGPPSGHGPIDWIICGGESGGNAKSPARPMHPDWARSVRDQCQAAGVPFFFKQWGSWAPQYHVGEHEQALLKLADPKEPIVMADLKKLHPVNMRKVGKKAAGRLLDGREWNEMPGKSQ
ncbi:MAG: phage Gp37/Gp68 family protein [Nitrospinaceae bacterium]